MVLVTRACSTSSPSAQLLGFDRRRAHIEGVLQHSTSSSICARIQRLSCSCLGPPNEFPAPLTFSQHGSLFGTNRCEQERFKRTAYSWCNARKHALHHRLRRTARQQRVTVECKKGGTPEKVQVAPNSSMSDIFEILAQRLIKNAASVSPGQKYIVGLAGSPGSGKTTLARTVTALVNMKQPQSDLAVMIPMDGYHLYKKQLDQMPDPKEAHARRGSHWTFDAVRLLAALKTIRENGQARLPSFDHGVGDPVEEDIVVKPENKIVLVEGNYLLLDEDKWRDLRELFDETWFLEVDIDVAMRRVLGRHIKTGKPPDVAKWRVNYNDKPNGLLIAGSAKNADLLIPSLNFVPGESSLQKVGK